MIVEANIIKRLPINYTMYMVKCYIDSGSKVLVASTPVYVV